MYYINSLSNKQCSDSLCLTVLPESNAHKLKAGVQLQVFRNLRFRNIPSWSQSLLKLRECLCELFISTVQLWRNQAQFRLNCLRRQSMRMHSCTRALMLLSQCWLRCHGTYKGLIHSSALLHILLLQWSRVEWCRIHSQFLILSRPSFNLIQLTLFGLFCKRFKI